MGSLSGVMKGMSVSMDMKRGLRNSILIPALTYGSENWTWNGAQQSRLRAVEMSYLIGVCGVSRWDGLSNESVYERCGMRGRGSGLGGGGGGWSTLTPDKGPGGEVRLEHLPGQDRVQWHFIGRGGEPSAVTTPRGDASGVGEVSELLID